jgi:D-beta-D-heptose 7-phosphate kinase/D-beta-D-heptose 1-phosphate adenosyltransferase
VKKVFVNGTFDLLHPGHIKLLNYAKSLGDFLLIALDSDERIKQLKGDSRPINDLASRITIMQALKPVDDVTYFSTDNELISLIFNYQPDIMIVGSDYKNKKVIGSEYAKELRFFERIPEYSTTSIIEYISSR